MQLAVIVQLSTCEREAHKHDSPKNLINCIGQDKLYPNTFVLAFI